MKHTLIASLISLMSATSAMAADPTSPVAPTIPTMITVSPNATAALAEATTNSIFIDQSGDNPTVNMTQIGSGNKAGSALNAVYLRGIGQNIVTIQQGDNNDISTLQVINGSTGSVGASVTIEQIGNSNSVDAVCGDTSTGCDRAKINWQFRGDSNSMYFRGKGSDLTSQVDVTGNGNVFNVAMIGNGHSQIVNVNGDNNNFNLSQTSTGASGSSIVISQTGTGTTFNVQQSGAVDNVLSINSASNGGSFNILQRR
jgi:acid stress-induced BolA-like protein IbaG/YrbA